MTLDALDILALASRDGLTTPLAGSARDAILLAIETTLLPREITFSLDTGTVVLEIENRRLLRLTTGDHSFDPAEIDALCAWLDQCAQQSVARRSTRPIPHHTAQGLTAADLRSHLGLDARPVHDVAAERLLVLTEDTALAYSTEADDWGVRHENLPLKAAEAIRTRIQAERIPEDALLIVQCQDGFSLAIVSFYGDSVVVLLTEEDGWDLAQGWAAL